ncbi:hypothetical protein IAD21_04254 [Abditibacteriota bacterium]|nr:hypothetical protein IAD21_04254 [Abditibacteriota bacterium]
MKFWLLPLALIAATSSASLAVAAPRPAPQHSAQPCATSVLTLSRQVATLLKQNNTSALSLYVDSRRGLQFSPEAYADKKNVKLSRRQVAVARTDKKIRIWGDYDGEGGPIKLTWTGYRKRFVWPLDYTRKSQVTINGTPKGRSTVINNLRQFYPNSTFVEFYVPPSSKDSLDWSSLWMVWKKSGGTWRLIGIAHDEWST